MTPAETVKGRSSLETSPAISSLGSPATRDLPETGGGSQTVNPHTASERGNRDWSRKTWTRFLTLPGVRSVDRWITNASHRRWLLAVVGIGLLVRLLLAPITAQADLSTYAEGSVTMVFGGGPFTYIVVYPPAWTSFLNVLGQVASAFLPGYSILAAPPAIFTLREGIGILEPTSIPSSTYLLIEKLPLFLFDLLTAGLLFEFVRGMGGSVRAARLAFSLWFLNPLVIAISAIHGAYDVIPTFFLLASFYLAFQGRVLSSGAALGLGITTKIFPVFFLPLLVSVVVRRARKRNESIVLPLVILLAGLGAILLLVFGPDGTTSAYSAILLTGPSVGQDHGGFGIWSFVRLPGLSALRWWLFYNSSLVGSFAIAATVGLTVWVALRFFFGGTTADLELRWPDALLASSVVTLVAFASVQPQYLLWVLPALLLVGALEGRFRTALAVVTAGGTAYYVFGLAGPLYLFQPLAAFTSALTFATIKSSIDAWSLTAGLVQVAVTLPTVVLLALAARRSYGRLRAPREAA